MARASGPRILGIIIDNRVFLSEWEDCAGVEEGSGEGSLLEVKTEEEVATVSDIDVEDEVGEELDGKVSVEAAIDDVVVDEALLLLCVLGISLVLEEDAESVTVVAAEEVETGEVDPPYSHPSPRGIEGP